MSTEPTDLEQLRQQYHVSPLVLTAADEVESLRARLAAAEAETGTLRTSLDGWVAKFGEVVPELNAQLDDLRARLARVQQLCDEARDEYQPHDITPWIAVTELEAAIGSSAADQTTDQEQR